MNIYNMNIKLNKLLNKKPLFVIFKINKKFLLIKQIKIY